MYTIVQIAIVDPIKTLLEENYGCQKIERISKYKHLVSVECYNLPWDTDKLAGITGRIRKHLGEEVSVLFYGFGDGKYTLSVFFGTESEMEALKKRYGGEIYQFSFRMLAWQKRHQKIPFEEILSFFFIPETSNL